MSSDESADQSLPAPVTAARDLSDSQVGELQLIRRLGTGGMADVYLALQTSLNRSVAVKILKEDALSGGEANAGSAVVQKRFEQEARAAGGLNHPNIVQIFTTGREGRINYIVQEYVPGLNLAQWIRKHGSPDYGTGLKWMQQVASAMQAAADAGIVHRDIKPENIMITAAGVAKVTDFGLAQLNALPDKKMNLTQAGTTMGTPLYMSPEQIQGDPLDHRSDQYSLGVTCFHMFAGRPPFPGRNAVSVAVQHMKEEPPALGLLRADLPKQLCETIHRMMAKKPADRFQTHEELQEALIRLERIPVNTQLGLARGWKARLLHWFPDLRTIVPAVLAAMLASYVGASQLIHPARLPAVQPVASVVRESSAVRQFGAAILNSRDTEQWKAVIDGFPDSMEAEFAMLRLGLLYVSRSSFENAEQIFSQAIKMGEAPEFRHMKVLGLTGKAYALSRKARVSEDEGDVDTARTLRDESGELLNQILDIDLGQDREIQLESIFSQAPAELRDFYGPIRSRSVSGRFFNP